MQITLNYNEIAIVLAESIGKKTQYIFGEIDDEDCFFTVIDTKGNNICVNDISFTWSVDNEHPKQLD